MPTQLMNEDFGLPSQMKVRTEVLPDSPAHQSRIWDCKTKSLQEIHMNKDGWIGENQE